MANGDIGGGTNTATVEGVIAADEAGTGFDNGETFSESDDADFTDNGPANEANATVNVSDLSSEFGGQDFGSLNAADFIAGDVETFTYDEEFTFEGVGACEELKIDNTASVVGDEDEVLDSEDETVIIETECNVFKGETATGNGLAWSKISGAPNTWFSSRRLRRRPMTS